MSTQIFVNLPVSDLKLSMDFFGKLGYQFNPQFSDEKAACMVISQDIYVMLLVKEFYQTFTPDKNIADTGSHSEVILALSAPSRQQVDELADLALQSGGKPLRDPEDHGWMYSRSFQDPDGHLWEVVWMDESAAQPGG